MVQAVFAIIVIAAALFAYFAFKGAPNQENMRPEGLDAFRVTYNQEGMPIPLHWGIVRMPGNLMWYGNLETEEVKEDVGGKGGGGGGEITTGYKYFLDHWQAVCMGPAMPLQIFVDNKPWLELDDYSPGNYDWYGDHYGSNFFEYPWDYSPVLSLAYTGNPDRDFWWSAGSLPEDDPIIASMKSQIGEYANRMEGVAFAWFDRFLAGENRTFLPTVHFVVERYCQVPLTYANEPKGCNPAAVLYEILIEAGVGTADINTPSFQDAADYWHSKGYAINMSLTDQVTAREAIQKVFNYVDGAMYMNEDDQFVLKAFTENDSSLATINTEDFLEFSFERPSWDEVYSDFRAEFIDEDKEYSKRALRVINSAVRGITGYTRQMSVNLTAFRDVNTASKRLWEIARKNSYPASTIQFTTDMRYSKRVVGDVITINNTDYGIVNAQFRIISKNLKQVNQNKVRWVATQFLEGMFLDTYLPGGGSKWVRPDTYAYPAKYTDFFEMPFNPYKGRTPAFLILTQRQNLEQGYIVRYSNDQNDWYTDKACFQWSVRYNLDVAYPNTTEEIDDDVGMILTPDYREESNMFVNLSRTDLFLIVQVALVDDEIMAFQYYQPYGSTQVKLTGIIRGLWNTPIQSHAADSKVWLTRITDNFITGLNTDSAYLKILPFFMNDYMLDDVVPTHQVTITNKSLKPWPVGNIRAVRTTTTIVVTWWPSSQDHIGAGTVAETNQTDEDIMKYDGDFYLSNSVGDITDFDPDATSGHLAGTSCTISQSSAAQTIFSIKARRDGYYSDQKQITIPAADGEYWA